MDIKFDPNLIGNIKPAESGKSGTKSPQTGKAGDFASILKQATAAQPIKFSAHAQRRLESRGIEPDEEMMTRLHSAIDRAGAKGSRDSLVLVDSMAFIVAVKNRTVITAMEIEQMKDDVVTNIDSAVIA